MKNKTFVELAEIYQETINKLERLDIEMGYCWDNDDKEGFKSLEMGANQHIDTLFEIEEILDLRNDF